MFPASVPRAGIASSNAQAAVEREKSIIKELANRIAHLFRKPPDFGKGLCLSRVFGGAKCISANGGAFAVD